MQVVVGATRGAVAVALVVTLQGAVAGGPFVMAQGPTAGSRALCAALTPQALGQITSASYASTNSQMYNAEDSGSFQVYVEPFPSTGQRRQVSVDSGAQPVWRQDGREPLFLTLGGTAGGLSRVCAVSRGSGAGCATPRHLQSTGT